jgi:integrase
LQEIAMFDAYGHQTPAKSWNTGRIIGPKAPLKAKHIWEIRTRLTIDHRARDLALFNLAIDSKLRGCDLVKLRLNDVITGMAIRTRSTVIQQKTSRPVPFELTEPTRDAITNWVHVRIARNGNWLFPSRSNADGHLTTRQYARLVDDWITMIGRDPSNYGTHSLRRTKVAMVYKRTGNLRACQLLLGHTKLESTVRYLASRRMMRWHFRSRLRFETRLPTVGTTAVGIIFGAIECQQSPFYARKRTFAAASAHAIIA